MRSGNRRIVVWWLLAALGTACVELEAGPDEAVDTGSDVRASQCGPTWDGEGVEMLSGRLPVSSGFVATHRRAVGILANGCSGTLVGDDLFLTAAHCVDSEVPAWVRFGYQRAPDGSVRGGTYYPVSALVESANAGIDYAVLRVSDRPGDDIAPARVATSDLWPGAGIALIGHPATRPMEVSAGRVLSYSATRIYYNDVDTLGGNSGSGVLSAETGELIGVHTNGGCRTSGEGANFGRRIGRLLEVSPILRDLSDDVLRYSLRAAHSNRCVDVADVSDEPGAPVIQWDCTGGLNQVMELERRSDGYYRLRPEHSKQCLDVAAGSDAEGAAVIQWPCHGGDNQAFGFFRSDDGGYQIRLAHSQLCLTVAGGSGDRDAGLVQSACTGDASQRFFVE